MTQVSGNCLYGSPYFLSRQFIHVQSKRSGFLKDNTRESNRKWNIEYNIHMSLLVTIE